MAALRWLADKHAASGTTVHDWDQLTFYPGGTRVRLKHPQRGVHRPDPCSFPVSGATSLKDPYGDSLQTHGSELRYRYQGKAAQGGDLTGRLVDVDNSYNRGLRRLMELGWPLIHFRAVASGKWLAVAPVVILNEDPETQTFGVGLGASLEVYAGLSAERAVALDRLPKPWVLDQGLYRDGAALQVARGAFRREILEAYEGRCAACSVDAPVLLEAARIVQSGEPASVQPPLAGSYDVRNGLSLCKLHHAAYERRYLGISPDYRVELRPGLSIPDASQPRLHLPSRRRDHPSPELLAVRWEQFRAGA